MMPVDGLITMQSSYGPEETMKKFETAAQAKGMTIFAKIDHAAGAAQVGLPLRPTSLIIFGNPKGGTAPMQIAQTSGIDLPLKALVWQDASGTTWLSYNDPQWIANRHGLQREAESAIKGMSDALHAFASAATGHSSPA
jgi:uncharacterized protein (DUF302 family)